MHVFIVSLVSCLVLTFLLRGAAHHFGIVDHPGGAQAAYASNSYGRRFGDVCGGAVSVSCKKWADW